MKHEGYILITVEILRWVVLVAPLYLAVWRYSELLGYTIFISGVSERAQFWGVVSVIIIGGSLVVFLPIKIYTTRYQLKHGIVSGLSWRPSMLMYILLSAAPTLSIILVAAKLKDRSTDDVTTDPPMSTSSPCDPTSEVDILDPLSTLTLQISILGLTLTEWISKLREEHLTYDLVTAMADDFFFAYDVIDFVSMATVEPDIYRSRWVYACFAFSFVAMFKYVPSPGTSITGSGGPRSQVAILVSMLCCEVPFVVIRFWTLAEFRYKADSFSGDVLHPLKNVALIAFDLMQLAIIRKHKDVPDPPREILEDVVCKMAPEKRRTRCTLPDHDPECESSARARSHWGMIQRRLVSPENDNRPSTTHDNTAFRNDSGSA